MIRIAIAEDEKEYSDQLIAYLNVQRHNKVVINGRLNAMLATKGICSAGINDSLWETRRHRQICSLMLKIH